MNEDGCESPLCGGPADLDFVYECTVAEMKCFKKKIPNNVSAFGPEHTPDLHIWADYPSNIKLDAVNQSKATESTLL